MIHILAIAAALVLAPAPADAAGARQKGTVCYSAKETRQRVARLRLANPLTAIRREGRRLRAQPLRSRLCRRPGGRLIYRLYFLRRDGKVVRTSVSARTGQRYRRSQPRKRAAPPVRRKVPASASKDKKSPPRPARKSHRPKAGIDNPASREPGRFVGKLDKQPVIIKR